MSVGDQNYNAGFGGSKIDLMPLTDEEKNYLNILQMSASKPGCICPPTSELTCKAPLCPRHPFGGPNGR